MSPLLSLMSTPQGMVLVVVATVFLLYIVYVLYYKYVKRDTFVPFNNTNLVKRTSLYTTGSGVERFVPERHVGSYPYPTEHSEDDYIPEEEMDQVENFRVTKRGSGANTFFQKQ